MVHGVPLVKFGRTVINLANVDYAIIRKEDYSDRGYPRNRWVLTVYFSTPITNGRSLRWTYDTEADAQTGLDAFHALNTQFVISEFP